MTISKADQQWIEKTFVEDLQKQVIKEMPEAEMIKILSGGKSPFGIVIRDRVDQLKAENGLKEMERALKESETAYYNLFVSISDMIDIPISDFPSMMIEAVNMELINDRTPVATLSKFFDKDSIERVALLSADKADWKTSKKIAISAKKKTATIKRLINSFLTKTSAKFEKFGKSIATDCIKLIDKAPDKDIPNISGKAINIKLSDKKQLNIKWQVENLSDNAILAKESVKVFGRQVKTEIAKINAEAEAEAEAEALRIAEAEAEATLNDDDDNLDS